jgi:Raf kinase inhibitor-like YbhB/YbcL family protein
VPHEPFVLRSPEFEVGAPIPPRHTCDGEDVSPFLTWTAPPRGTRSLAITMEDADVPGPGGDVVHWHAWGLSPELRELPEGVEPPFEGRNSFGAVGYRGPCPPVGEGPHHYVFRIHALAEPLDLPPASDIADLREAIAVQVLAAAEHVGTYERRAGG